jgi:mono/diheme cytochrome c family protein
MLRRLPVFLLVVFGAAGMAARQSVPAANPLAGSAAAVGAGQTLFTQLCQGCHGPAGQGGGDRGPALTTGTFTHGSGDADLFRAIRSGMRGTQMAPFAGVSDTQSWQLVAYLRSLGPAARAGGVTAPGGGDTSAGEALFFGRAGCASCHEVNARGAILGPDLSNAGRFAAGVLRAKIVSPSSPEAATALLADRKSPPMTDRSVRGAGDNLFTDSVVALDPDTGRRKWHYQFTPNDGHD